MHSKKQFIFVTFLLLLFSSRAFSVPLENIKEYALENGLSVFVLEDKSTPLIRIEYSVHAGFSNQTKETSGFFKLYTRLIQAAHPSIDFDSAECYADSSRYITTIVPSKLEQTMKELSQAAFSNSYSDSLLAEVFAILKKEVTEEAASPGGFINAAIDSKVFSNAPWKHDSGVYPSLFNKTTTAKARTILKLIEDRYYTPQNSALFISGNINENTILALIQETFGNYYSSYSVPVSKPSAYKNSNNRKFVLHSKDFSADMTQIVIQYTLLSMEESELAATMLNNDSSFFKYNLVNQPALNIPGNEYINAASAHKKDSSRLIIQSLLQKPGVKSLSGTTSFDQVQLFTQNVIDGIKDTNFLEYYIAQQVSVNNLSLINSSSTDFMSNLASYWAIQPNDSFIEETLDQNNNSLTAQNLFSKAQKLEQIDFSSLIEKLSSEEPFVFVIINSDDYKKNKDAYKAAGFEEITQANAAWYNQKELLNLEDPEAAFEDYYTTALDALETENLYNNFYTESLNQIVKTNLSNGIPVVTKYNENSSDITILISIQGGKLNSADDNGFEEVMINLLAGNIQKEILLQQQKNMIIGTPLVDWSCNLTTSTISIQCIPYDFNACCKAVSNAIVFGEISPAQADRAVANRQYKKRLENGSVVTQMIAAAIKEVYPKTNLPKVFEATKEILQDTTYQKILSAYPALLDASRYSLIITGLFPENAISQLETNLGMLTSHNYKNKTNTASSNLKNNTKKTVKLNHTFLTDIPAEKAGPMPSKLIPTTEFLDPVVFVFNIPEFGSKENALFFSTMKYLEKIVQKNIDSNTKLKGAKASADTMKPAMDISTFTIQNVSNQKEADAVFRLSVIELNELLNSNDANQIIREIKDLWITEELEMTLTNTGTALLLQKGFEFLPYELVPEYYLMEYNFIENASREDFISILDYIPQQAHLRFYAK